MGTFQKAVPESMFWLTILAVRLLAGFSKPDMTVNILSASSVAYQKGLHRHNRLIYFINENSAIHGPEKALCIGFQKVSP